MTRTANFRVTLKSGKALSGTFLKTPHHVIVEVLAHAGLDFLCIDAEHGPFDRTTMDPMMAVARMLDIPMLVRLQEPTPGAILGAMDMGAVGVVVPHVDSVEKAEEVVRAAHFGLGGRGYAGSSRWAGYATRKMPDVRAQDAQTVVIVQIEEPAGVEAAAEIAAVEGVDGLFIGPADLSISYGHESIDNDDLKNALTVVGEAARGAGKAFIGWVAKADLAKDWAQYGMHVFFIASEHTWMINGARAEAEAIADLNAEQA